MTDVLTAIDEALETGVAADDDPLTREFQELALALQADAPEPTPVFREWLDGRVEEGFPKPAKAGAAWWQRLMHPAAATGVVAAAVIVVVVAAGGSGTSQDVAGGDGGGGGAAMEAGGGEEAASSEGDAAAKAGAEPFVDDTALSPRLAREAPPVVELPPSGPGFAPGQRNRKIERAIGLELEMPVDEMARVAERVTVVTNRHGGFVLSSSVSTGEDSAGGDFELRIPANRLRPALRDLTALADVRTQSQSGRDVTRDYVTARDRLRAARAERRSLLRRLEIAATDEEAESIRRRLDLVAGEINGLRGELRDLRLRTDYAVVTVSLLPSDGDSDGGGASGSFDDALRDAGDLLVAVAGVLVRVLAVALPIGLIALAGWAAGRTLRRRRRESALI
jgi:hypothetical protein